MIFFSWKDGFNCRGTQRCLIFCSWTWDTAEWLSICVMCGSFKFNPQYFYVPQLPIGVTTSTELRVGRPRAGVIQEQKKIFLIK